jgi:hypothetical protein
VLPDACARGLIFDPVSAIQKLTLKRQSTGIFSFCG